MMAEGMHRALRRLESRVKLGEAARAAVLGLPAVRRKLEAQAYLVREGDAPSQCAVLLSGYAIRHKMTGDGGRQIISLHIAGEFLDLQNSLLRVADHNVQMLVRSELAMIPVAALRGLADEHPDVARAMWIETLVDAAIYREWVLNVGRRNSVSRIAHLLCELARRLEAAGLGSGSRFELPMTQEQLADASGLTAVHINRVLQELGRRGLVVRDRRMVEIRDWDGLRAVGDFSARYLHLPEAPGWDAGSPINAAAA
ncbi:MAG: Crp/Fnr family transcriptional regulator [Alphaproteobacteria bacterium]|nr:Crp/Fnr family transcriptional regulator [Alphaproteobacteria bacterium]